MNKRLRLLIRGRVTRDWVVMAPRNPDGGFTTERQRRLCSPMDANYARRLFLMHSHSSNISTLRMEADSDFAAHGSAWKECSRM